VLPNGSDLTELDQLKRRSFITLLGGVAAWPLAVRAQQPEQVRRIGALMGFAENDPQSQAEITAFREELGKVGWTEGRNIKIDVRWAAADIESMKRFAKELVELQPDLILTSSTPATGVMLQHTSIIPIIFVLVADPVGSGYVASLQRRRRSTSFAASAQVRCWHYPAVSRCPPSRTVLEGKRT
jgi:putative tryptophan/tyrosine transport system substrate-binding protein